MYSYVKYNAYIIFGVRFDSRGRDDSVGTATHCTLDGPGIESAPVQPGPGAHPASYTMGTESLPGVKRPGRGVVHPPTI
jgi:hypothetical protein